MDWYTNYTEGKQRVAQFHAEAAEWRLAKRAEQANRRLRTAGAGTAHAGAFVASIRRGVVAVATTLFSALR